MATVWALPGLGGIIAQVGGEGKGEKKEGSVTGFGGNSLWNSIYAPLFIQHLSR
jgi:hypothetical protein